ncbi:hypothetical protein HYE82_03535 [Streptomyces sp. BR123]|uniref:hypothetical protein n=1 Tax=Streptomyces sp. BR123 TaxID=2749828 RepID=UPI0015C42B7C|nr:hypothetical protein [Streptomyces sp. BR123]NXY93494.1 hypothetical protein [Streptomyces sp. BR123]
MPLPVDLLPPSPQDIWRAIRSLQRDLRELMAARRSERTGTMRVYTSAGTLIIETGPTPSTHLNGSTQEGIRLYREDGSLVAAVQAEPSVTGVDTQCWTLYDRLGNAVVADDPIPGMGLGLPYIPIPFARSYYWDWPGTFSIPWVDMYQTTIKKQQAMAYVSVAHTMDTSGATGEIQVTVNGAAIGSPTGVIWSVQTTTVGPFSLPGDHLAAVDLRVQARFTGGAGSLRCEVLAASQIQS